MPVLENNQMLTCSDITCELANFSLGGLGINSPVYWGRKTVIEVSFVDEKVSEKLKDDFISPFQVEIVWGIKIGRNKFRHGVKIVGLSKKQLWKLNNTFRLACLNLSA